ncbi:MAG TPA: hypothetical protein VHS58_23895 [Acetobacteraceae bacterium]|nr:hypothetical protein [Acetobacteraceae bacterium]
MPDLPTPRSYAEQPFRVIATSRIGTGWTLDLPTLASGPHADTRLLELPLRCRCGARDLGVTVAYERAIDHI